MNKYIHFSYLKNIYDKHLNFTEFVGFSPGFSVLDPTTTCQLSVAYGVVPSELAPSLPPATRGVSQSSQGGRPSSNRWLVRVGCLDDVWIFFFCDVVIDFDSSNCFLILRVLLFLLRIWNFWGPCESRSSTDSMLQSDFGSLWQQQGLMALVPRRAMIYPPMILSSPWQLRWVPLLTSDHKQQLLTSHSNAFWF